MLDLRYVAYEDQVVPFEEDFERYRRLREIEDDHYLGAMGLARWVGDLFFAPDASAYQPKGTGETASGQVKQGHESGS